MWLAQAECGASIYVHLREPWSHDDRDAIRHKSVVGAELPSRCLWTEYLLDDRQRHGQGERDRNLRNGNAELYGGVPGRGL